MTKRRIICVGSRLVAEDSVGLQVFDELNARCLPPQVELIEGGLAGLNLLPFFFGCDRVILVDRVVGFAPSGSVIHLSREMICAQWDGDYSPASELLYLLKSLPFLGIDPLPVVRLIGVEGAGEGNMVERAADMALEACL